MENILSFVLQKVAKHYSPSLKELEKITVDPCKLKAHGDLTTNVLMILKKQLPENFTKELQEDLKKEFPITDISIVGPGFLNMKFLPSFWQQQLLNPMSIPNVGQGEKILLEFLSANPTGPLHIGHARNAILGDALARILQATGFDVTKEYYINDAGAQIEHLGESLKLRYEELHGRTLTEKDFEGDMYPGEYLIDAAKKLDASLEHIVALPSTKITSDTLSKKKDFKDYTLTDKMNLIEDLKQIGVTFKAFAVASMMDLIREDLKKIDVTFDVFTSEQALLGEGLIQKTFDELKQLGDVKESTLEKPKDFDGPWEARQQWVFESTKYGDDQDRAFTKGDGSWTYFAGDVAYHFDKYKRGFHHLINVFGADHIGYIKRIEAAVASLSKGQAHLNVLVCQLVKFLKNGEPLKMSKRANTFIAISDVVDEIGSDALRFLLLMRRHDMGYDFDLQKAVEKTKDNPVFYVQYATARIGSLSRRFNATLENASLSLLEDEGEIDLIKKMSEFPRIVALSSKSYEPHRVANYCYELASDFHALWSKDGYRFLIDENAPLTRARMTLAQRVGDVLTKGLSLLGVSAPDEM